MSAEAMVWAKRTRTGSATRKVVLLVLADYADDAGQCYPGQKTIAAQAELSPRSVWKALADLEEAGLIRRAQRRRDDGYRSSDRITLMLDDRASSLAPDANENAFSLAPHDNLTRTSRQISLAPSATQEPKGRTVSRTERENTPAAAPSTTDPPLNDPPADQSYPPPSGDLAFDEFWRVYPLQAGYLAARREWNRAKRHAPDHVIVAGAIRYRDDPNREDRYTAHPAKWLRGGHWADNPKPADPNGATKVQQSVARIVTDRAEPGSAADVAQLGLAERRRTAFRPAPRQTRELPT